MDAAAGGLRTNVSSVATLANTYLGWATGTDVANRFNLTFLENVRNAGEPTRNSQNLVTATVVPLPAAGLLLFGAIGALGVASRRLKAPSAA